MISLCALSVSEVEDKGSVAMTDIYSGAGWLSKSLVDQCDGGDMYSGYGWGRTSIGSYRNGEIYSGHGWEKH